MSARKETHKISGLIIIPLLLIIVSCFPKKNLSEAEMQNSGQIPTSDQSRGEFNREENKVELQRVDVKKEIRNEEAERAISRTMIKAPFAKRIVPDDFLIGPLQDLNDQNAIDRSVIKTVEEFCAALMAGRLLTDRIDEINRTLLGFSLSYFLDNDILPRSYRLGVIDFSNPEECRVPVRLLSDNGSAEGEFYLEKKNEVWLISDIQVNLQNLQRENKEGKGDKFKPNKYSRITGSF